jgi:hypothetical protein
LRHRLLLNTGLLLWTRLLLRTKRWRPGLLQAGLLRAGLRDHPGR